jgi:hypothetical protein
MPVFIGCGNNTFSSIRNFTIENSTFRGQNGSGTALDITGVNLTIVNGSFFSNSVGRCFDIFDINTTPHMISIHVGGVTTFYCNIHSIDSADRQTTGWVVGD